MRIAYINADRGVDVFGSNGSGVHVRELVSALARRGHQVHVVTAAAEVPSGTPFRVIDLAAEPLLRELRERMGKEARALGHTSTRAAEVYGLLLNRTVAARLEALRGEVDLVYERQSLWSYAGLEFARREGLPFFLEVNAPLSRQQLDYRALALDEVAAALEGALCTHADRVLVTSPALADYTHTRGASRRHLRLVRCGAPRELFDIPGRPRRGVQDEFVLGFVGSLKPWHGIEILLHVFERLRQISPVYRLLVVGDGPMMAHIRAFCREHGLEEFIELPGRVPHDEMPRWLGRMDAGMAPYPNLPSFYFSPLKIWEYAAAGVPIVASSGGELPKLFPHKTAALLHPPGKIHKILKHVETLRQNPDLGRRLARRARRGARLHTWDRIAARVETIATRALAEGVGHAHPRAGASKA